MVPKLERAFETRDLKFFNAISTPDFVDKEMGSAMTKAQAMEQMKMMFQMAKSINCHFNVMSTSVAGNNATLKASGHIVTVMKPQGPKDKKTHTMVIDMWTKETWVKAGTTWKIKMLEEAKPAKMTMDGKPYNPSMAAGHK